MTSFQKLKIPNISWLFSKPAVWMAFDISSRFLKWSSIACTCLASYNSEVFVNFCGNKNVCKLKISFYHKILEEEI